MASKPYRAGRILVSFFVGIAILFGLVALAGSWKPELGLDLQGGTRITLTAQGNPSSERLDEAQSIIDQRVNGTGVAEAEVTTQGGQFIVVEIPGDQRRDLIETVQRQAQLRFRLVGCSDYTGCGTGTQQPGNPLQSPTTEPTDAPQGEQGEEGQQEQQPGEQESQGNGNNRPPVAFDDDDAPAADETDEPAGDPTADETPADDSTPGLPTVEDENFVAPVEDELAWMQSPGGPESAAFGQYACAEDGSLTMTDGSPATVAPDAPVTIPSVDDPSKPLVTCSQPEEGLGNNPDQPAAKYLLSRAVIQGTDLDSASAGVPQNEVNWIVNLEIGGDGEDAFSAISRALVGSEDQFAIVLDGTVLSAPTMEGLITNGQAQISGNFTEASANSLATSLKFGALPLTFTDDPTIETVGPTLAGNQLSAGLWAGGLGLGLVMLYCLLYYRALGIVVLGSFAVAAAITYALVLLLSETANFTLTLPGIAGFIIAVGVTADSFILYFERIRDEMREGKSMRVAVYTGWKRAKITRLAANTVSLLSAAVLYIFATGAVKGFGFALGLSTLIDLAVLFWFTRPAVTWFSQYKFFNGGGRLSGLSPETLGIDAVPSGGKA